MENTKIYRIQKETLDEIGDAIREKIDDKVNMIDPLDMPSRIRSIGGGGDNIDITKTNGKLDIELTSSKYDDTLLDPDSSLIRIELTPSEINYFDSNGSIDNPTSQPPGYEFYFGRCVSKEYRAGDQISICVGGIVISNLVQIYSYDNGEKEYAYNLSSSDFRTFYDDSWNWNESIYYSYMYSKPVVVELGTKNDLIQWISICTCTDAGFIPQSNEFYIELYEQTDTRLSSVSINGDSINMPVNLDKKFYANNDITYSGPIYQTIDFNQGATYYSSDYLHEDLGYELSPYVVNWFIEYDGKYYLPALTSSDSIGRQNSLLDILFDAHYLDNDTISNLYEQIGGTTILANNNFTLHLFFYTKYLS